MWEVLSGVADLVLGRACVGCQTPGPGLCPSCLTLLRSGSPPPVAVVHALPSLAATTYDGLSRRALLGFKEKGIRSLAAPLGLLLADAVRAGGAHASASGALSRSDRLAIVPVPPHPRAARGFDAVGMLARAAAADLSTAVDPVPVADVLRSGRGHPPLKELSRDERRVAVAGAFHVRRRPPRDVAVIVVDDIRTTGATTSEAVSTLLGAGVRVVAVATVAASPGRSATSRAPAPPTPRW